MLDGLKSRASLEERLLHFQLLVFLGKMFGCVWYPMEKLLDVSRGTPSLENRPPISKYWGIVKEFGISWGERWATQKAMFCFVKGTCCPRSKTFLGDMFSISKLCFLVKESGIAWKSAGWCQGQNFQKTRTWKCGFVQICCKYT
jgi:hypothetical protein